MSIQKKCGLAAMMSLLLAVPCASAGAADVVTETSEAVAIFPALPTTENIESVTSLTRVFGTGATAVGAAIGYPEAVDSNSLNLDSYQVPGKEITAIYTNDRPALAQGGGTPGRYVILEFRIEAASAVPSEDKPMKTQSLSEIQGTQDFVWTAGTVAEEAAAAAAPVASEDLNGIEKAAGAVPQPVTEEAKSRENVQEQERKPVQEFREVPMRSRRMLPSLTFDLLQRKPVQSIGGNLYLPAAARTTTIDEPDVKDFRQGIYADPATGAEMPFNLYLPKGYEFHPEIKYPMVVFLPDASANVNDDRMPLLQGNGATVWASPEEQAKHPCIVLAPQYTQDLVDKLGMMTTDDHVWTDGLEMVKDLIFRAKELLRVDVRRIYGTGQSQGGMANIAISSRYPDLFAAQYLVACQWDAEEMAALRKKNLWITVCEGDAKAYPGMNAATKLWQELGTEVAKASGCDSHAPETWPDMVANLTSQKSSIHYTVFAGGNHAYTWTFAYDIEGIRDWLFSQKGKRVLRF